jgi:hypothetical protein
VRAPAGLRAIALCSWLVVGCTNLQLEIGDPIDEAAVHGFTAGETDRAQVLAVLGAPLAVAAHESGSALLYEHIVVDELQLGLSLDSLGRALGVSQLGWLKASLGDSDSRRRAALLVFDADAVLVSKTVGEWTEDFGTGGSVQVFVSVAQVVDSGELRTPVRGLGWGRELLDEPLVVLNGSNLPDTSLIGISGGFGQYTLEQREIGH